MSYTFSSAIPRIDTYFGAAYALFEDKPVNKHVQLICGFTNCTDYMTDKLMYPEKAISLSFTKVPDFSKVNIVVALPSVAKVNNFIEYGLPLLHKIEKANRIKRTRVVKNGTTMLVYPSRLWYTSTFMLSFYLKVFRNFCNFEFPVRDWATYQLRAFRESDKADLTNPLLVKIALCGKMRSVNKGLRFVHGWKNSLEGNHSNNGIQMTMYILNFVKRDYTNDVWNNRTKQTYITKFKRLKNLQVLEQQLNEVKLNEMPFL